MKKSRKSNTKLARALRLNQPLIPSAPKDSQASKTLLKGYAIYDEGKKRYSPPYFFETEADAVRGFVMAATQPGSMMSRFPADYTYYFIGDFDFAVGHFTLESQMIGPKFVTSLVAELDKAAPKPAAATPKGGAA